MRPEKLRIAQVAPLWTSVPPSSYGGSELIVHLLTEELVRRGHDVTLFASGDSRTSAKLRSVHPENLLRAMELNDAYEYEPFVNASLVEALLSVHDFDLIHCHLGAAQLPITALSPRPVLCTLHVPACPPELWALSKFPAIPVSAVSRAQVAPVAEPRRATITIVPHGIDFDAYEFGTGRGGYLAFLARMGPQKSPHTAIAIAQAARMPIILAGRPQNGEEVEYFKEEVEPLIDGKGVQWIGGVDHARKCELLRNAAALLFPIQGEEAFGIAMIEAMACGTPVVAAKRASVPEVVDFGITGFYGATAGEMAALVSQALALDRKSVRQHAFERFSHGTMTDNYLALYRSLITAVPR